MSIASSSFSFFALQTKHDLCITEYAWLNCFIQPSKIIYKCASIYVWCITVTSSNHVIECANKTDRWCTQWRIQDFWPLLVLPLSSYGQDCIIKPIRDRVPSMLKAICCGNRDETASGDFHSRRSTV